jgi:hypothetical protein
MSEENIRVFISYSHDSPEHKDRCRELADRLRTDGIDAVIDQYHPAPPEGRPRWMEHQIDAAKFVLVVCTPILRRRFEGKEEPGVGQGANFEGFLATQVLYADGARNEKFVPVLFEPQPANAVPRVLQAFTRYSLGTDYDSLYRHLTGQPAIVAPPLGARKLMPPRAGATTVAPTLPATPVPAAPTIPGADAVLRARDHVHALHELLLLIYDPPELRQFLRFHDQGEKILRSLPGENVSKSELVFKATDLLHRWGLVDAALFDRLQADRPRHTGLIASVRARWSPR